MRITATVTVDGVRFTSSTEVVVAGGPPPEEDGAG